MLLLIDIVMQLQQYLNRLLKHNGAYSWAVQKYQKVCKTDARLQGSLHTGAPSAFIFVSGIRSEHSSPS